MLLEGAGIVVTGAGHGIGRALARRLAGAGARVVVNDLDGDAAHAVAAEIGGFAAPGDAASELGVDRVIEAATQHLGFVDAYFANAGVDLGGGADAPEEDWALSWEVNVMAQVRAARRLLPSWLEAGRGRFVITASAAGLLTMLGSAPYSTTKHAAVAFAEWLSATYGGKGIVVQAICPQGVRTRMLEDAGPVQALLAKEDPLAPEDVADLVVAALGDDRFLVLPHPKVADYYAARAQDTDRWLRGMRKLQRTLDTEVPHA